MPRTPKEEHVETLSMAEPPEVNAANIRSRDGMSKARARGVSAKVDDGELPTLRRYRVLQDKMITVNGFRTRMHVGKEISTAHYDVVELAKQGLKLKRIEEDEDAASALDSLGL
jgi:methylmalonyl-CoA mutase N-terminal domain/subunit